MLFPKLKCLTLKCLDPCLTLMFLLWMQWIPFDLLLVQGLGQQSGVELKYKMSKFHRIIPGFMAQVWPSI